MSDQINIEKRVVQSLPALFGELGGLYDFLSAFVIVIIGSTQSMLFKLDQITMFRVNTQPNSDTGSNRIGQSLSRPPQSIDLTKSRASFSEIKPRLISKILVIARAYCCLCLCRRVKRPYKLLQMSDESLSRALDTRTIINY